MKALNAILTTILSKKFAELENLVNCLIIKKSSTNQINFIYLKEYIYAFVQKFSSLNDLHNISRQNPDLPDNSYSYLKNQN